MKAVFRFVDEVPGGGPVPSVERMTTGKSEENAGTSPDILRNVSVRTFPSSEPLRNACARICVLSVILIGPV